MNLFFLQKSSVHFLFLSIKEFLLEKEYIHIFNAECQKEEEEEKKSHPEIRGTPGSLLLKVLSYFHFGNFLGK